MAISMRQLLEKRETVKTQIRAIVDSAASDSETEPGEDHVSLTPEELKALDDLKKALDTLDSLISARSLVDDPETRGVAAPIGGGSPVELRVFPGVRSVKPAAFDGRVMTAQDGTRFPLLERRHSLASFCEARSDIGLGGFLRALYSGPQNELERRVLAEATIGSGGAMVPTPLATQVLDLLRSQCVAFQAGALTIPMESQTLRFARQIADPVGAWGAEGSLIPSSDAAFDDVTLTANRWALIVQVSRELLEDGQNVDGVLQNVFAKVAALALDRAILFGTGTANMPLGIASTPGIQTISMGTNGAALTSRAPLLDAQQALQMANTPALSAFIMSPRTSRALSGLTDTLGQPLRLPPSLEGIPNLATTSCSVVETQGTATNASSILFGDFSQCMVGLRSNLIVSILQEKYADTGEIGFVLWLRADVALQHPASFGRISGVLPAAP